MIDVRFFTNERSKKFFTAAGSPFKEKKHGVVQGDGSIKLVVDNVVNIQEEIDSWEPSTNIYNIINRLSPEEALKYADQNADFFDAIGMPKSYAEALQLIIDGQNHFERMPAEIRQKFDNDFNRWFATAGTEEWLMKHMKNVETSILKAESTEVGEVKE